MQKSISISELRKNIADITDEVMNKKSVFVLIKNGKPVAKLVPSEAQTDLSPEFAQVVDDVFTQFSADLQKLAETP
jgi:prevent-host-death family protein